MPEVSWPGAFPASPQQCVGKEVVALAAKPRNRHIACVEQRTKKSGKEHDFGKYEPEHAHAKGPVHLVIEQAVLILANNGAEPAGYHADDRENARKHDVKADIRAVEPGRYANHQDQKSDGANNRPWAAVRYVVFVVSV